MQAAPVERESISAPIPHHKGHPMSLTPSLPELGWLCSWVRRMGLYRLCLLQRLPSLSITVVQDCTVKRRLPSTSGVLARLAYVEASWRHCRRHYNDFKLGLAVSTYCPFALATLSSPTVYTPAVNSPGCERVRFPSTSALV